MTEEQRDSLLIEMSKNIEQHGKELKKINIVLEQHTENLEKINTILEEHTEDLEKINTVLEEHTEELEKINIVLEQHTRELERHRQNTAKLEYNLTDKIMALFDLGEINKDKFAQNDLVIGEIQNTLDWYHRRLLKIEKVE